MVYWKVLSWICQILLWKRIIPKLVNWNKGPLNIKLFLFGFRNGRLFKNFDIICPNEMPYTEWIKIRKCFFDFWTMNLLFWKKAVVRFFFRKPSNNCCYYIWNSHGFPNIRRLINTVIGTTSWPKYLHNNMISGFFVSDIYNHI